MPDQAVPRIFRILLPANDLGSSRRFYERLFDIEGRVVAEGRIYFDCGPVILGVLDYSTTPAAEWPKTTEAVYLATSRLEELHRRARTLAALSTETLHGDPENAMGEIRVRPWGERSFYLDDPSGNPLCFVDDTTVFTGTPEQVNRLRGVVPKGNEATA